MAKRSLDYVVVDTASSTFTVVNFVAFTGNPGSPIFNSKMGNSFGIRLDKSDFAYNSQHIIFYFYKNNNLDTTAFLRYQISLIDANGKKQHPKIYYWKYIPNEFVNCYFNMVGYIHFDTCKKYLVNGKLTIKCEVEILESEPVVNFDPENASITNDLNSLLQAGQLTDVTLLVADKEYQAHKAILGARSPVFAAMFSHDCQEKIEGRVQVPDISTEAFDQFLSYIYSDTKPSTKEHFAEIFIAADKYQLINLKSIMESSMSSSLDTATVADILLLADAHEASQLKAACIEFIIEHSEEMMASSDWKKIVSHHEIMTELFKRSLSIKAK